MGPPLTMPRSEKTVSFQKSILGPRPKHIIINNAKVPVASDNEVKQFDKPLSKPGFGFSKPNFRSKTLPPRRVNNNYSRPKTPQPKRHVGRQNQPHGLPICLGVDLEPDEWIKDIGCSKHMTGNSKLFTTYKAYNGGNVIFGSNLRSNINGKGQICDNKCRVTFFEHDSEITMDGKVIGYSQNSKAYIILNKHTRKVKESLNVTFDETPPPSKTSPLVNDDLDEEEAIKVTKKKNLENDIVDETLEIDEIVNIKESRNHPLENVIGNLNQRTLRSQAQNQSNFFCFISTIEPKNVNEALGDESWIVAMQEELNQFVANDVWELVPQPRNMTIIGTKWVFRNKLDENGIVSRNKARLVAQGYNQQEGIDYDETYAPVARLESIRILLAYACALDFKLFQMDVKSAFLNGFINEEFEISMMGELNFFLGLQIKQMEDGIFFNQSKYIKEMLKKFGLEESKPMKTPMSSDTKLTKDEECESVDSTKYRGMIEMLKKFGLKDSKPMKTPMSSDTKLAKDKECELVDSTKYRGMIGACVFTDRWRLDELAYDIHSDDGQVRRIRHEEEIDVLKYQVLTHEIKPTLKPLEEIIRENTKLENESYVLYDRVMNPLAAQLERKPRRDRGTRKGRHSTSSSSAFDQASSSHLNNDDDNGNDKGTSCASTPSLIRYVNSLTNQVP
ncbi:retrovirus-related pol polyprotein from transposon TNT 1-94 [Tanacetum coccineum]